MGPSKEWFCSWKHKVEGIEETENAINLANSRYLCSVSQNSWYNESCMKLEWFLFKDTARYFQSVFIFGLFARGLVTSPSSLVGFKKYPGYCWLLNCCFINVVIHSWPLFQMMMMMMITVLNGRPSSYNLSFQLHLTILDHPGGACSGKPFVDVAQITSSKAATKKSWMVADVCKKVE